VDEQVDETVDDLLSSAFYRELTAAPELTQAVLERLAAQERQRARWLAAAVAVALCTSVGILWALAPAVGALVTNLALNFTGHVAAAPYAVSAALVCLIAPWLAAFLDDPA
jgi:hypothetical protein